MKRINSSIISAGNEAETNDTKTEIDYVTKKFEAFNSTFGIQAIAVAKLNTLFRENIYVKSAYFYQKDAVSWLLSYSDIKRGRDFVLKKIKNDPQWFEKFTASILKRFNQFRLQSKKLETELEQLTKISEVKQWLKKFINYASITTAPAYITDLFGTDTEYWIKISGLNKNTFMSLLVPPEMSFSKEYEYTLAKIKMGESNKTLMDIISEYHWVQNNYKHVNIIDVSLIKKQLTKLSKKEAKKIILEVEKEFPENLKKTEFLIAKLKINKFLKDIIQALRWSIVIQDRRKAIVLRTNSLFVKACGHLLNFYKLSVNNKKLILSSAYPVWLTEESPKNLLELCNRSRQGFLWSIKNNPIFGKLAIKKLEKFIKPFFPKDVNIIVGQIAFPGKIKGEISIIENREDYLRFKTGNILVTSMTRPEMAPIMKKAAGFITDEGGVTCHAAIMAREMKKPCVIGTKIATKVFKDGDLVEVDATRGVVHKINKR